VEHGDDPQPSHTFGPSGVRVGFRVKRGQRSSQEWGEGGHHPFGNTWKLWGETPHSLSPAVPDFDLNLSVPLSLGVGAVVVGERGIL